MRLDGIVIWVSDVPATVDFYRDAFGLSVRWMRGEGDYAQLETGSVLLQFAAESAAPTTGADIRPNRAHDPVPGFQLALAADDVHVAFATAVRAGATVVAEPEVKPWGQTIAYVRDLQGVLVELATRG